MDKSEKIQHLIKCLEERHRELDTEIQVAHDTFKDDWVVGNLKKQKLQIRDRIVDLNNQLVDLDTD